MSYKINQLLPHLLHHKKTLYFDSNIPLLVSSNKKLPKTSLTTLMTNIFYVNVIGAVTCSHNTHHTHKSIILFSNPSDTMK